MACQQSSETTDLNKIAFLFPGQGSQYLGMGKSLADELPAARAIFDKADEILETNISQLCFKGPLEQLNQTINTQPAIFTASLAAFYSFNNLKPDYILGHSLGEITALVAAGVLTFEDGLKFVQKRAQFMQEEAQKQDGGMAAVLGLSQTEINKALAEQKGIYAANFNSPGQVVISGLKTAIETQTEHLKSIGAKKIVPLKVSGAFHSPFMKNAQEKLSQYAEQIPFKDASVAIVQNYNAEVQSNGQILKENLIKQLTNPVMFQQSLFLLDSKGVTNYAEIGPGKVLSGLVKRTLKTASIHNIEDIDSLESTVNNLVTG
ncbi:MAG: [acyl-carrier-protein] S-malonyltransferase [Actinobacteria bacterium]|nr:MAG: [acyl-carrier-protein] S-malonyltransferase [Actinomycetota bacterium]